MGLSTQAAAGQAARTFGLWMKRPGLSSVGMTLFVSLKATGAFLAVNTAEGRDGGTSAVARMRGDGK